MPKVSIPYRPRNWARRLHAAATRWIVLIIHRRGGKTTGAFNHLQKDALAKPGTLYAYIAPTFTQAKRIVWEMAKKYSRNIPGIKYNSSELLITYPNGSQIMIVGSDNPDSLRGIGLWGCFIDEYPMHSDSLFTEIISKALADHLGYCIFGGTPKGRGHFYRIYQVAKEHPEEYTLIYKTIDQSLVEEEGEVIENLRAALEADRRLVENGLMTEDEFQQEWYNSFEAALKGAVYIKQIARARAGKRFTRVPWEPNLPVYTVWDLGVGDAMAIGFYQRSGKEIWMIDYHEDIGGGLIACIKEVRNKPYVYGKHFAPHDIRHKEMLTGKTRIASAAALKFEFEVVPSISVRDGIDLARAFFNRLWVDSNTCEKWVDFIGQYRYKYDEHKRIYSKDPVHDFSSHAADVHRYAAIIEDEMVIEETFEDLSSDQDESEITAADEYVGHEQVVKSREGFGKHKMLRNVNIGAMGHAAVDKTRASDYEGE